MEPDATESFSIVLLWKFSSSNLKFSYVCEWMFNVKQLVIYAIQLTLIMLRLTKVQQCVNLGFTL